MKKTIICVQHQMSDPQNNKIVQFDLRLILKFVIHKKLGKSLNNLKVVAFLTLPLEITET